MKDDQGEKTVFSKIIIIVIIIIIKIITMTLLKCYMYLALLCLLGTL